MENIIKKIKKGAKHTRLSAVEKAEMKSVLVRHMKLNPVNSSLLLARGIPSPFNINNFRNKKGISILVIVSLLMGGSVSLAAENTVPGDVLFTVKVHVNENVRGAVAVTPKAKAEWEVRLVERRLEEVEKLAVSQGVTPAVQNIAEDNLAQYTKHVENRIAKFEEDKDDEDAIETASKLSEVFNTHEQVLADLSVSGTPDASLLSTSSVSTVTPVSAVMEASHEQTKNTLKKVQNARDDAEKKHKELIVKYAKEKTENADATVQQTLPQPQIETKSRKSRNDSKDTKSKEKRTEEIRSTVATQEASVIGSTETQNDTKRLEDKKKEEAGAETPKVEDRD